MLQANATTPSIQVCQNSKPETPTAPPTANSGKQQAGDEQEHDARYVAVEHERRNRGDLPVLDLHFLGRELEDLHDVVVDEAHDRLVEHDLEQEIRRPEQQTGESGLRQHARFVARAQGIGRGNQEGADCKPKHRGSLDKCCGPLGRSQGIDEQVGDEWHEHEAEGGLERFHRKLSLDGEDVEGGNQRKEARRESAPVAARRRRKSR